MTDLVSFINSNEIIIYSVMGVTAVLCFIIYYYVDKNAAKRRMKHNTRELNKLVEKVKEEIPEEKHDELYDEPVIEPILDDGLSVSEMLEDTIQADSIEEVVEKEEPSYHTPLIIDEIDIVPDEVELEYTEIEPDQATAKLELKKLTEELQKEAANCDTENIPLTRYEEEQEETAIISLEELVKKSKEMYEANELTQYKDEGDEPISLHELATKAGIESKEDYQEPFILRNVIDEVEEEVEQTETNNNEEVQPKFKTSPIISPIYGIEANDLALENTANYEKLDESIRSSNEFLMTLKDLQNELK